MLRLMKLVGLVSWMHEESILSSYNNKIADNNKIAVQSAQAM